MEANQAEYANISAQKFNFRELASATKNFRQECLLGEGGFGKVYKGTVQATGQVLLYILLPIFFLFPFYFHLVWLKD